MVLIIIPGVLLWFSIGTPVEPRLAHPMEIQFWLGLLSLVAGIILAGWTVHLQLTIGQGTPAPWDPTKKLVVEGPYRYVRNPMISGAMLILLGESNLLHSWPIAIWLGVFLVSNLLYLPLVEEKELEKRFGDEFRDYKSNVPRWIPRLKAVKQIKTD